MVLSPRLALVVAALGAASVAGAQTPAPAQTPPASGTPPPAATAPAPAPAPPPPASPPPANVVRLSLEETIRQALRRAPEVRGAEAEVEGVRGKQLQARGAGLPQIEVIGALGPSPRARGNQVSSPDDQYSPDVTGVFVRAGVEIIQPIFTWGLIRNAKEAAEHGVLATQAGVDVKSREVSLKVKEAYWGFVAASTIRLFLLEVRTQLDEALQRTRRLVEGGYSTDMDVYRLIASRGELEKGLNQVDKNIAVARDALSAWTGQPSGTAVEPADAQLPSTLRDPAALAGWVSDAQARRPEFVQLREGLEARKKLVEVEKKKRYPLFFLGLLGSAAYATNRDQLDNPFVIDPLNHLAIGPVLGFKYNLDFGIADGKIKEAQAEVLKLEALQSFASDNIPLQVAQAYGTVVEAKRNAEFFDQAHRNSRQWLVAASSNSDLGIGDQRDLADAFLAYARTRADYLQALYAYVFGLEQLSFAAGLDLEEVRRLAPPPR
jgi:outer membrane protein